MIVRVNSKKSNPILVPTLPGLQRASGSNCANARVNSVGGGEGKTLMVKGGVNAGVSQTISCHILPYDAAFPSQTRLLYVAIGLPCASLTPAGIFAPPPPSNLPGSKITCANLLLSYRSQTADCVKRAVLSHYWPHETAPQQIEGREE